MKKRIFVILVASLASVLATKVKSTNPTRRTEGEKSTENNNTHREIGAPKNHSGNLNIHLETIADVKNFASFVQAIALDKLKDSDMGKIKIGISSKKMNLLDSSEIDSPKIDALIANFLKKSSPNDRPSRVDSLEVTSSKEIKSLTRFTADNPAGHRSEEKIGPEAAKDSDSMDKNLRLSKLFMEEYRKELREQRLKRQEASKDVKDSGPVDVAPREKSAKGQEKNHIRRSQDESINPKSEAKEPEVNSPPTDRDKNNLPPANTQSDVSQSPEEHEEAALGPSATEPVPEMSKNSSSPRNAIEDLEKQIGSSERKIDETTRHDDSDEEKTPRVVIENETTTSSAANEDDSKMARCNADSTTPTSQLIKKEDDESESTEEDQSSYSSNTNVNTNTNTNTNEFVLPDSVENTSEDDTMDPNVEISMRFGPDDPAESTPKDQSQKTEHPQRVSSARPEKVASSPNDRHVSKETLDEDKLINYAKIIEHLQRNNISMEVTRELLSRCCTVKRSIESSVLKTDKNFTMANETRPIKKKYVMDVLLESVNAVIGINSTRLRSVTLG